MLDFNNFDFTPFRDNLKKLIDASGLSNPAFAEKVGTSNVSIHRYLTKQRNPDLRAVLLIADCCNVSVDWLLGLKEYEISETAFGSTFLGLYDKASEDDKRIVNSILSKYKE